MNIPVAASRYAAAPVANTILARVFASETSRVTPMQLQRILYVVAAEYARETGVVLMHEPFLAWDRGPVLASVHDQFAIVGADPIRWYAKDSAGRSVSVRNDVGLDRVLDRVLPATLGIPAATLSNLVCLDGSAWRAARRLDSRVLADSDVARDDAYRAPLGLTSGGSPAR